MKNHKKKSLAPLVVTAILIAYYVVYFAILASLFDGIKYILGIVPIVFGAIMVKVCIERIKEIQGGEEDDLSKY